MPVEPNRCKYPQQNMKVPLFTNLPEETGISLGYEF